MATSPHAGTRVSPKAVVCLIETSDISMRREKEVERSGRILRSTRLFIAFYLRPLVILGVTKGKVRPGTIEFPLLDLDLALSW